MAVRLHLSCSDEQAPGTYQTEPRQLQCTWAAGTARSGARMRRPIICTTRAEGSSAAASLLPCWPSPSPAAGSLRPQLRRRAVARSSSKTGCVPRGRVMLETKSNASAPLQQGSACVQACGGVCAGKEQEPLRCSAVAPVMLETWVKARVPLQQQAAVSFVPGLGCCKAASDVSRKCSASGVIG